MRDLRMEPNGLSFAAGQGPEGGDAEERGDGQDAVGDAPSHHLIPALDLPGEVAYSGDLGHPIRRHAGHRFRRKPAGVGAKRRWAFGYLSHVAGAVKLALVFRREPPFRVS